MSAGAYLLVKFNDQSKLVPTVQLLDESEYVSKWDAVYGYYDLVIKLKAHEPSFIEKIKKLEGCDSLTESNIESDNEEVETDPEFIYAYVYIETDPDKKDAVQKSIESLDNLVFCSLTSGSFDFIVMLKGEIFNDIDQIVNNQIRNLDGVLRLKQDHVIYLDRI